MKQNKMHSNTKISYTLKVLIIEILTKIIKIGLLVITVD